MSGKVYFDSQTSFQGGMQNGFDPSLVGDTQYYRLINGVCRDGTVQPRPTFIKKNLDFSRIEFNEDSYNEALTDYQNAVTARDAQQMVVDVEEAEMDAAIAVTDAALLALNNDTGGTATRDSIGYPDRSGNFVGQVVILAWSSIFSDSIKQLMSDDTDWVTKGTETQAAVDAMVTAYNASIGTDTSAVTIEDHLWDLLEAADPIDATNQAAIDANVVTLGLWKAAADAYDLEKPEIEDYDTEVALMPDLEAEVTRTEDILSFSFDAEWVFLNGKFQGEERYQTETEIYTVACISGHIFLINMVNNLVSVLTNAQTKMNEYVEQVWMVQAEDFFIVQDGKNLPKIINGYSIRTPDESKNEIPVGRSMAYGHGRIAVQISDNSHVVGDIYLAYEPENVLRFRETLILNEGGGFTVQSRLGSIITLAYVNVSDTSTGDGPLLAICENGFTTFAVNNVRTTWSQIAIQKVQLLGSGIVGQNAYVHINEDMLYRSHEGIRSYAVSRSEAAGAYKYTELSREVEDYIQNDKGYDSRFLSMTFFDKRMLATTAPKTVKAKSSKYYDFLPTYEADPTEENLQTLLGYQVDNVCFKGIIAFDFSMAGYTKSTQESQYLRQTTGSYDGIWTGIRPMDIFTVIEGGQRRCFAMCKDSNDQNAMYEISKETTGYDGDTKIDVVLETKAFPGRDPDTYMTQPFSTKRFEEFKMWVDSVESDVSIIIEASPNTLNAFTQVGDFELKAKTRGVLEDGEIKIGAPQARPLLRMKTMEELSDATLDRLIRQGQEFMLRIKWSGMMKLRRIFLEMMTIDESEGEGKTHDTEGAAYPFDTFDQYSYSSD